MKISQELFYEDWLGPLKIKAFRQLKVGGVLTERRLAKYIGVSHVTASAILGCFAKDHIAVSKRVGRANLWSLNPDSYGYQVLDGILSNLEKIAGPKESLKHVMKDLLLLPLIQTMILFGSVIDGTERDESDIDLAVILRRGAKEDNAALQDELAQATEACFRLFGKRLSPYVMTEQSWAKKKNSSLGKAIQSGEKVTL